MAGSGGRRAASPASPPISVSPPISAISAIPASPAIWVAMGQRWVSGLLFEVELWDVQPANRCFWKGRPHALLVAFKVGVGGERVAPGPGRREAHVWSWPAEEWLVAMTALEEEAERLAECRRYEAWRAAGFEAAMRLARTPPEPAPMTNRS